MGKTIRSAYREDKEVTPKWWQQKRYDDEATAVKAERLSIKVKGDHRVR